MDFKKGNRPSVSEAFELYSDILYRLALTHTSNREDAEDVCQDVFIKYSQTNTVFKDLDHVKAWLIRVCINRCHDIFKRNKIRNHLDLEEIRDVIADSSKADEYLRLTDALNSIPDKYRDIILLHYYEGYSLEECTRILCISLSNAKMRLMRARELMKDKLTKED